MSGTVGVESQVESGLGFSAIPIWVPRVFLEQVFLYSFVFYVIIGLFARWIVKKVWPGKDAFSMRKKDSVGRWSPSLVHALIATLTATCAGLELVPADVISNQDVIMHSLGYFMGDLVVDHDPDYIVHHVGPVVHAEVMLRLGAQFWHCMRAGWIMEAGNVVAHTAAVLTFRRGPVFHAINTWSFWISRPASYYDGFMAWFSDVPAEVRFTWLGMIPLISILGVYHANTKWMIQMCRARPQAPTQYGPDGEVIKQKPQSTESSSSSAAARTIEPSSLLVKKIDSLPSDVPLQRSGSRKGKTQRDKDA